MRAGAALGVVVLAFFLAVGVGPRTGRYRTLAVLSGSMEPGIPTGGMLVVTPLPTSELRVGDVITYNAPIGSRPLVTHRIIALSDRGPDPVIRTKGDANEAADPWVARLTGPTAWKARFSVPTLGRLLVVFGTRTGRLVAWVGVPLALGALWLAEIWRPRAARGRAVQGA